MFPCALHHRSGECVCERNCMSVLRHAHAREMCSAGRQMDEWVDRQVNGWMDGWIDGRMDE
eukprot:362670-Chlamydomonas_euryale.AAC.3